MYWFLIKIIIIIIIIIIFCDAFLSSNFDVYNFYFPSQCINRLMKLLSLSLWTSYALADTEHLGY